MHRFFLSLILWLLAFSPAASFSAEQLQLKYAASDWPPFTSKAGNGEPQGLYIDILDAILTQELGISFEHLQVPWKRAQFYVEQGEADFLVTVSTEERRKYAVPSTLPVLRLYLHLFTYTDHPQKSIIDTIRTGEDIKRLQLTPVTNIGNEWHKINIDSFGVATHYVDNEKTAFRIVAEKRADFTIEPVYAGYHMLNTLGLAGRVEMSEGRFGPIDMYLLMSKKSQHLELLPKINEAILKLTRNGTIDTISSRYKQIK